jgi:hypothetical protein
VGRFNFGHNFETIVHVCLVAGNNKMVPDEKEVLSAHACLGSSVELKQSVASKRESNVH